MKNKSALMTIIAAAFAALPGIAAADGGWFAREWNPESTNAIRRFAMPHNVCSPGVSSASSQKARIRKLLAANAVSFTPGGLLGRLPQADDSRIQELARGLDHDWKRCFVFVRNNIAYAPYPGIVKGPERTLLDREGNAADQSFLLCALLHASGYDTATVLYMPLVEGDSLVSAFILPKYNIDRKTPYNAVTWLGGHSDGEIAAILDSCGMKLCWMGDDHIGIEHYWVRVEVDGEMINLDPTIVPSSSISAKDATGASGYNRISFLSAAGGSVDANSARNLSKAGIANYLTERINALKTAWNAPGAAPATVLGGRTIDPYENGDPLFHGEWFGSAGPIDLLAASSEALNGLRVKVLLDSAGSDFERLGSSVAEELFFYLDEVGARTLWFGKDAAGDLGFYVGDEEISHSGAWRSTGGTTVGVRVAFTNAPTYNAYTMNSQDGHVHVLGVNFGADYTDGIRKTATQKISELRKAGVADTAPRMIAANLQLQAHQWLSQVALHEKVWNRVVGANRGHFYNIGIAGQTTGPFVDMANSFARGVGGKGRVKSQMLFSSALEHSVIEQLNGTNNPAVSTVKLLALANASGAPIYFADSNNVATVMSSLSGYSANRKAEFTASAMKGGIYLLPKNATITLNQWRGMGYIEHTQTDDGAVQTGMIISGGMNGGFCSTLLEFLFPELYILNSIRNTWLQRGDVPQTTQSDPVVMPAGAFIDNEVDLSVSRAVPLSWSRSYDTRCADTHGDLGRGWAHGFDADISETTDADAVLGASSLDAILPTVVAATVAEDMMSETDGLTAGEIARRWTAAALVANWWTEQIPQACVVVKTGATTHFFQKMPDGSYAAAPGVTATLTRDNNGIYSLHERHGNTYVFNADKKLASITDPSGNTTTLVYVEGKLARVENPFGATMTIARDSAGRIASVTDNSGKSVSYSYDANGCMTAVTDAAGEIWPYIYDSTSCRMVSKKNPNGDFLVQNAYNGYGQVTNQISSNGQTWRFGYVADTEAWNIDPKGGRLTERFDSDGRILSHTGRDGATSTATYDGHGHVVVATDALGNCTTCAYDARDNLFSTTDGSGALQRTSRMGYDAQDRLVAATNALGHVTTYEYDACDRVIRKTLSDGTYTVNVWNSNGTLAETRFHDSDGNILKRVAITYGSFGLPVSKTVTGVGLPASGITTRTEYNADGSVAATIDALGNRTTFAYDSAGRMISTTDPLGNTASVEYNRAGQIVASRDALGRVTRTTRTVSGLPLRTIRADGTTTETAYDVVEEVASTTDARGARRTVERDAENRPVSATDALGNASQIAYDTLGRPVWAQDASGIESRTEYDALSRPVSKINALGAAWSTSYDKLDRAVTSTTPLGKASKIAYDSVGQVVATTRPTGAVDAFGYDAMGNQTVYTNSEKHVYRTSFDARGRVTATTNALGVQVSLRSYDLNGNIVRSEDGNGAVRTFAYDALDRLVSRTTPDDSVSLSYDAVGNLVSAANKTATETFAYDAMNRLVAATTTVSGMTVRNEWKRDAGGLVTSIVYTTGKAVSKQYDIEGRLVAISDWLGHTWTFNWDAAGRLLSLSSPDGRVRTQSYDSAGRLVSWNVGTLVGRTLEYDLADRKTSDTVTFGAMPVPSDERHSGNVFDAADRLVSSKVELGSGATLNETFTYDGNDAMIRATANGDTVSFRYDADRSLASMTVGGNEATFAYDALGNRLLAGGHIWIPDQNDALKRPFLEYDSSGSLIRFYIWAGGMLLGYVSADGTLTVAHTDEMGGIAALSKTDGMVLHTAQYGPHGENWGRTGSNPTPFAWLGGFGVQRLPQDTFLGDLYLTRHRLYAPAQQRFLSSDPMGLSGGLNLYAYGKGNPLAYIDPLGLCGNQTSEISRFMGWDDPIGIGGFLLNTADFSKELVDAISTGGFSKLPQGSFGKLSPLSRFGLVLDGVGGVIEIARAHKGERLNVYSHVQARFSGALFAAGVGTLGGPGGTIGGFVLGLVAPGLFETAVERTKPYVENLSNWYYSETPMGQFETIRDTAFHNVVHDVKYGKDSALDDEMKSKLNWYRSGVKDITSANAEDYKKLERYRRIKELSELSRRAAQSN